MLFWNVLDSQPHLNVAAQRSGCFLALRVCLWNLPKVCSSFVSIALSSASIVTV
jgi:hypothetical protein